MGLLVTGGTLARVRRSGKQKCRASRGSALIVGRVRTNPLAAYVAPFAIFMGFIALVSGIRWAFPDSANVFLAAPEYWVYPLQTAACAGALIFFWRSYSFAPLQHWPLGIIAGLVALGIWVSPQVVFGVPARTEGFNPEALAATGMVYWLTVLARFARLVIVVPLLEEIFWRGFLLRYFVKEDFTKVAFGTYTHLSFFVVAVLFAAEHSQADWIPALLTGLLYNGLAVRTKSLFACVLAHAVTNFGLGLYIMSTRQWGFW